MNRILDWRLRVARKKSGLPDLPEVRALMRISFWNGFTFGALERRVTAARRKALIAVARDQTPADTPADSGHIAPPLTGG